jgi:hypothetical protein
MKKWWNEKKVAYRKRRKAHDTYTFLDFIFDLLFYIPELVLFPFRMIFWLVRGLGKMIDNVFDIF